MEEKFHMTSLHKKLDSLLAGSCVSNAHFADSDFPGKKSPQKSAEPADVSLNSKLKEIAFEAAHGTSGKGDPEPVSLGLESVNAELPEDCFSSEEDRPMKSDSDDSTSMVRGASTNSVLAGLEQEEEEAEVLKEMVILEKLKDALRKAEYLTDPENMPKAFISIRDIGDMSIEKKDTMLDIFIAVIILMNAVVIGISMDYPSKEIEMVDLFFNVCFLAELCCKLHLHGFRNHFSQWANIFDFLIVAVDLLQLTLEMMNIDLLSDAPAASLFRVARLVRLVRLIRIARLDMLDDLVALISGMVGGMTTLMWCIVLFFLILYCTSLLFREFFGRGDPYIFPSTGEDMTSYFNSVPRCLLTVFRFFFGDFGTEQGIDMFQGLMDHYGAVSAVFVCALFFMITIGLFNVIAAIFVESTLAAANEGQIAKKTDRMNNEILWSTRITSLVRKLFEYNGNEVPNKLSEDLYSFQKQAIPEDVFERFMVDPKVVGALNDLEIDESDHKYLFDILDNDNTGSIIISQLTDGLERLRGDPRRSDIICVDLMVRSIQQQTDFLVNAAKANVKNTSGSRKEADRNTAILLRIEELLLKMTEGRAEWNVQEQEVTV
jgi:hypothetical protein